MGVRHVGLSWLCFYKMTYGLLGAGQYIFGPVLLGAEECPGGSCIFKSLHACADCPV